MNGKKSPGGEDWPGRNRGQPQTSGGGEDEGKSQEQAMEQAQEEAAEEREDERGYQ